MMLPVRGSNPLTKQQNEKEGNKMKTIHNGKRYNSDKCEILAERDHYSHSNNYSGTTRIVRASDGTLLIHTTSNGQDCWTQDAFYAPDVAINFEGYRMDDEQAARCAELGLIVEVE
jgi:hypothetical protein